jgi:hypothetical protein
MVRVVIVSVMACTEHRRIPAAADSKRERSTHRSRGDSASPSRFAGPTSGRRGRLACLPCRVRVASRRRTIVSGPIVSALRRPPAGGAHVPAGRRRVRRAAGAGHGRTFPQPFRPSQPSPSTACCALLDAEHALEDPPRGHPHNWVAMSDKHATHDAFLPEFRRTYRHGS